jgi:hypothetical protein
MPNYVILAVIQGIQAAWIGIGFSVAAGGGASAVGRASAGGCS